MATQPQSSKPDNLRRGPIWLLIAHRPGVEKRTSCPLRRVSPFEANNEPIASIGNQRFAMFTKGGETAWGHPNDDGTLGRRHETGPDAEPSTAGHRVATTSTTSSRCAAFTKAFNKISEACGI